MIAVAEKHKPIIEESIARLISRAANARGLGADELRPRIDKSLEKYLFRDNENVSAQDVKTFIDELRADDLCLVLACEKGDEAAWTELVATQDKTVKAAAWKISPRAEEADDLASSIWAELYGLKHDKDGNLKSKLSYYSGRGSLGGWLRAIVSQLAVDQFRKQSRLVQVEEAREFENLANESSERTENLAVLAHHDNPEEIFDEKQLTRDVSRALNQAIAELDADDKLILKLYYYDELKLKEIAQMFGYHEATASRKVVRIQTEIRKSVERILKSRHGWSDGEVRKYLAETASKLGISLEKLVAILIIFGLVQEVLR
ncbi:MAG: sigma-70 family RNA polymerase sigma factor [Acidobacteria bacterium]|nr:sigma-70 family RNA polymerase sigma factor [Acidobacteriota bacterium]